MYKIRKRTPEYRMQSLRTNICYTNMLRNNAETYSCSYNRTVKGSTRYPLQSEIYRREFTGNVVVFASDFMLNLCFLLFHIYINAAWMLEL